ncbi:MAG: cold-shock protein [Chloroflexi bacterium]|nr:cold-shock protein [Chloroflexota bacterium]
MVDALDLTGQEISILIAASLAFVNIGSVIGIWWDKRRASKNQRRIKEETLLVWALLGGWPGGVWTMRWLRHKTSRRSFITKYAFVVTLNLLLIAGIAFGAIESLI